jgi:hypothetical protein
MLAHAVQLYAFSRGTRDHAKRSLIDTRRWDPNKGHQGGGTEDVRAPDDGERAEAVVRGVEVARVTLDALDDEGLVAEVRGHQCGEAVERARQWRA